MYNLTHDGKTVVTFFARDFRRAEAFVRSFLSDSAVLPGGYVLRRYENTCAARAHKYESGAIGFYWN